MLLSNRHLGVDWYCTQYAASHWLVWGGGRKLALYKVIMGMRQTARLQTKSDAESVKPLAVRSLQPEYSGWAAVRGVEVGDVTTFYQVVFNNLHFRWITETSSINNKGQNSFGLNKLGLVSCSVDKDAGNYTFKTDNSDKVLLFATSSPIWLLIC